MDVNFEYYKIFYYAAKYRNITRAAAALGSSQPNVTRVLKILESQLNCRLFVREPRGIGLTEEGQILFSHVEVACRHLLNAREELGGHGLNGGGTVEIGVTETALHLFLLDVLPDFKRRYPGIKIKIQNHTTVENVRRLVDGGLDFAVITAPFDAPKGVSCEPVLEFSDILTAGRQYEHLCGSPLELRDVRGCPWVGLGRGTATYELYRNFFIDNGIDMELDMEVATSDLLLPLIEHNLGIGFVPERMAEPSLGEGRAVGIPLKCSLPKRSVEIVSDKGSGLGAAAVVFYSYCQPGQVGDGGWC